MTDTSATLLRRACLTECTARKPGNVHPGAGFEDLAYEHFVAAASIAAETLPGAATVGVGPAVLDCVRATVAECGTNVNLGLALLLAPLCGVPRGVPLADGIGAVLAATTVGDAEAVYEAIRLANPGGLGTAAEQDVRGEPTVTLTEAMILAADRDSIAAQYACGFAGVANIVQPLSKAWERMGWEGATGLAFLSQLSLTNDSHIVRRCGLPEAAAVRERAAELFHRRTDSSEWPFHRAGFWKLDAWLRGDGHRRNPGTTADLTAAALFWAAREGAIELPTEAELAAHAARIRRGEA